MAPPRKLPSTWSEVASGTSLPAATADRAGEAFRVTNTGVDDAFYICLKDAANTYHWEPFTPGGGGGLVPVLMDVRSGMLAGVTGNGEVYTIVFSTADVDEGDATLNVGTGEITVNSAGKYRISALVHIGLNVGEAGTCHLGLALNGLPTNHDNTTYFSLPGPSGILHTMHVEGLLDMAIGDDVTVTVNVVLDVPATTVFVGNNSRMFLQKVSD